MTKFGRTIKTVSMMLCLMVCIGSFHFARPAEAAVDLQQDMLRKVYTDVSGSTMPYRLYLPADYSANKTYPTIIFLHGAGERGTDNTAQLINMLGTLFRVHAQVEQAILIAPQCPDGKRWVETD